MNHDWLHCTDAELWQAFKKGNEEAFDYIFEKHVRVLYNYGRKFTVATEIIEDSVQDLFVELWEKRSVLSDTDSIKFYLFKALRLRIIRRLTKETKVVEEVDAELYDFTINFSHESQLIHDQSEAEQRRKADYRLDWDASTEKLTGIRP